MAGFVNKSSDNVYISHLKAAADTKNGVFVTPDYSAGTASAVADTTAGDAPGLLFVHNVNYKIDEEMVADADFTVASGKYLRAKALKVGDVITTDQITGTYADILVDSVMAVGAGGKVEAIGARTPALKLQVIEKTTLFGKDALKLIVISA